MGPSLGGHRKSSMIVADKRLITEEILKDSILLHLAAAYFSIGKRSEQKTQCPQTRGFVVSALRGGAALNQSQIAKLLGIERTVVYRYIKAMVDRRACVGDKSPNRALLVRLTTKGNNYRETLIKQRRAAEERLREKLTSEEIATFLRLLKVAAEVEF
jgi:DNA-binding MarR family transcriptional regulator